MLLRLKQYSLEWKGTGDENPPQEETTRQEPCASSHVRGPDPRDTVIRKLKEQVHALRTQLQERDKRIIDLEDEMHEIKSKRRGYKLTGEKKSWWKIS